ncbi:type I restriction enzyme, S subunit [Balnearium lithotrophicum]|uniref:Type I restriction enzyme, S subunit n=1 Tax=Balnearium lithotrophicum TaxID=223788 RepID=A0A521D520_9BACT|nr:restriction endonuclease subunit S [Balnearium lithotrophicum]SMO66191.1 type I restriction enzyme, S subunit [Balnearium lithotrophicum]
MELGKNEEFKETEIGLIPKDWEVVRLGDYITQSKEKNKQNLNIPVYTVSKVYGFVLSEEFFSKKVYSKNLSNYKIVRNNYFAYNPYRINVGSIALFMDNIGLVSPAYLVFKVKDAKKLNSRFLLYLLRTTKYTQEIKRFSMTRGSVRRSLSFKDLSEFKIPLPPISEQKAIAAVLDKVRETIDKTEEVINSLKEFKKSLMKHLFTYGAVPVDEVDKVKLKKTEVGLIPEHWEIKQSKDVFYKITDGTHDTPKKLDKGIPLIKSKQIKNGKIDFRKVDYFISQNDYELINKRSKVNKDDILISMIGTIGEVAYVEDEPKFAIKNVGLFKTNFGDKRISKFLFYYFQNTNCQNWIWKNISGTSQKYLTLTKLKQLPIPLPPIDEQKEIAEILTKLDDRIEAEERKKEALGELFKTLLNELMTGKKRLKKEFVEKFGE